MSETTLYLVRRHASHTEIKSGWWSKTEAWAEAERLAAEDEERTRSAVASGRVRSLKRTDSFHNERIAIEKWTDQARVGAGGWVTLRHYEVLPIVVQGSAVHRLAELVR